MREMARARGWMLALMVGRRRWRNWSGNSAARQCPSRRLLPAHRAAHLVREHENKNGRVLDSLREVGDGHHVLGQLHIGQILHVDVVGVDNLGQLAPLDLLLVHPHLNPPIESGGGAKGPVGERWGPGRRRQGPGQVGGHRPDPIPKLAGPQRPTRGARRRTLTVSSNWLKRTVFVPTMRATAEPLRSGGKHP